MLQRRYCYSMTGRTGSGKTAIALNIAASVALGRSIGGHDVERGRVLYFAGENPTDVQMRWIAMAQQMNFDVNDIDVHFTCGVFNIAEMFNKISAEIILLGDVSLVVIDTTAAFFHGEDENDNVQMGQYARLQRSLVDLPGGPTVLALCHPTKGASEENLLPRGGGAYLNEVDGNLTVKNNGSVVELHWQGKFRGADFAPLSFQLKTATHQRLKDSKGRHIKTVIAKHLTAEGEQALERASRIKEDQMLLVIDEHPRASLADLAKAAGWLLKNGEPNKMAAKRTVAALKSAKLVENGRNGPAITEKGKAEVKRLRESRNKEA